MPQTIFRHLIAPALLGLGVFFAAASPGAAQTDKQTAKAPAASALPATHPLLGAWRSVVVAAPVASASSAAAPAIKPAACAEVMDFRANRILLTNSGAEITRASFDVSAIAGPDGFYRLAQTVLAANGKPDCAGDLHSTTDDTLVRFIQFSPQNDQFIVCQSASLAACFGPFRKQPS